MDVVPANPDGWEFDPFEFSRDGDKLSGRGTTDCLGHVALLTELFRMLQRMRMRFIGVQLNRMRRHACRGEDAAEDHSDWRVHRQRGELVDPRHWCRRACQARPYR